MEKVAVLPVPDCALGWKGGGGEKEKGEEGGGGEGRGKREWVDTIMR